MSRTATPTAPLAADELAALVAGELHMKWLQDDGSEPAGHTTTGPWPLPTRATSPGAWLPPVPSPPTLSRRHGYRLFTARAVLIFDGQRLFLAEIAGARRIYPNVCRGIVAEQARLVRELPVPDERSWRQFAVEAATRAVGEWLADYQRANAIVEEARALVASLPRGTPLTQRTADDVRGAVKMAATAASFGRVFGDGGLNSDTRWAVLLAASFAASRNLGVTTGSKQPPVLTYASRLIQRAYLFGTPLGQRAFAEDLKQSTRTALTAVVGAEATAALLAGVTVDLARRRGTPE